MSSEVFPVSGVRAPIVVHDQTELDAALAAAVGGEVIALAGGDYGSISLRGRAFGETVTIVSADADDRATVTGAISLSDVSNLSFSGIDVIGAEPLRPYATRVAVTGSEALSFQDMKIAGALPTEGLDPNDPDATSKSLMLGVAHERGMRVDASSDVTIDGVEFTTVLRGLILTGSNDVRVVNSEFQGIRSDGINLAGTQDVLIENNYFHDFYPWYGPSPAVGDHPDFIQYMSQSGSEAGVHGVTIRGNVMLQGEGGYTQSIFGHNGGGGPDGEPFTNFEVSGNFIQNSQVHGITLGDVSGARVFGNVLIPSGAVDPGRSANPRPTIDIPRRGSPDGGTDIEIRDNLLTLRNDGPYAPGSVGEDGEERGVSLSGNQVLDSGRTVPAFWAEIELPATPGAGGLGAWIAAATAQVMLAAETFGAEQPEAEAEIDEAPPQIAYAVAAVQPEQGSDGDDRLLGGKGDDDLRGGAGDDLLYARDGDDVLDGGAGDDTLDGVTGDDVLTGGAGADLFRIRAAPGDADAVTDLTFAEGDRLALIGFEAGRFAEGDDDDNHVQTQQDGASAVIDSVDDLLELSQSGGLRIERAEGADLRLVLDSPAGEQSVMLTLGGGGEPVALSAGLQANVARGGIAAIDVLADDREDGRDDGAVLIGHGGSRLGADVRVVDGELIYDATGLGALTAPVLQDVVTYAVRTADGAIGWSTAEITVANRGETTHRGTEGADRLLTGNGDDVALGGGGDDVLYARRGDDWLEGGAGDDRIVGGEGSDVMFGGAGADMFDFYGADMNGGGDDMIADLAFEDGDRIIFRYFDAGTFEGQFESLKSRDPDGKHGQVMGLDGLAELDALDAFAIERSGETSLTLAMTSSAGAGTVELMFAADAGARLDEFWLLG